MTEFGDKYYVRFECQTPGATILYNHNFISPSYTPTSPYGEGPVVIPKESFKSGTVTMTARAVREGYTDKGVVTLTLQPSGEEQSPDTSPDYADTPAGEWYLDAVGYVMEKRLFDLTGTNMFSPGAHMTRAMLVTALYRLEGSPSAGFTDKFSDITRGTPLSAAVSWAQDAGVVNGYNDGTFKPSGDITRQEIAAMLHRYKQSTINEDADVLAVFTDGGDISGWARDAVVWAVGAGVIKGMGDGTVAPHGTATRAQVAQMLYNLNSAT
jgi:hypothetical protein